MDNKIGNFIKELRTERNWSQEDLAAKLYISRQSVSKWEIGQTTPSMSIMIKLAEIFELTLPEIINGERATKDNIEAINSETTKEIIKMHKKTKKITRIFSILICILVFAFLGYYFFTSYKTQNIYEVTGKTDNFTVNEGLFILTKSKIYFTIQNIKSNEPVEKITLYYLDDNQERHDIYSIDNNNSIFLEENNGYSEYFNVQNKSFYLKNLYAEIQSEKYTENMKLDLRRIYQNDELLNLNQGNIKNNKEEDNEIDKDKLINNIKSKFTKNEDTYNLNIDNQSEQLEFMFYSNTNVLIVYMYNSESEKSWTYSFDNDLLTFEKIETVNYEIIEQDSSDIKDNKEFIKEFIGIINDYVY